MNEWTHVSSSLDSPSEGGELLQTVAVRNDLLLWWKRRLVTEISVFMTDEHR